MKHYLDITLLPDAEANLGFLWQKVYAQIHLALVENKTADGHSAIAVSFPKYGDKSFPLGHQIRLLAETKQQLQAMNATQWLNRLSDYIHIKSMQTVPESVENYALFKRKQIKSNIEKKAQRRAIHLNKPYEEVLEYLLKQHQESKADQYRSKLPFITVESLSSQNKDKFHLFIEKLCHENPVSGTFDCYGLSKTATVPWF